MNSTFSIQSSEIPINLYQNSILTKANQQLLIKNDDFQQQFYFDYFQQKVAFITFDGYVKIYDIIQTNQGQKHVFNCEFKAHQGAIKSLSWQSPKMGSLIATCGEDQKIKIFKETGKVWREIYCISEQRNPLKIKWIENELLLVVGYCDGHFEIRQGETFKQTLLCKMFNQLVDFDLQLLKEDAILLCNGIRGNQQFIFLVLTIKLNDKQNIVIKEKCSNQLPTSNIHHLKIAPYMNNNEIKAAGQYENNLIIIIIEYYEELDQNHDCVKIKDSFFQLDSDIWQCQWSIFGNELQVHTQNGIKVYQQNINDQFVIL